MHSLRHLYQFCIYLRDSDGSYRAIMSIPKYSTFQDNPVLRKTYVNIQNVLHTTRTQVRIQTKGTSQMHCTLRLAFSVALRQAASQLQCNCNSRERETF